MFYIFSCYLFMFVFIFMKAVAFASVFLSVAIVCFRFLPFAFVCLFLVFLHWFASFVVWQWVTVVFVGVLCDKAKL